MPIDQLREYVELGFRIAFWGWFAAFALTAANLGWHALVHHQRATGKKAASGD